MKIYVGNLSYSVTEDDLRTEFGAFGKVDSVSVVMDRDSGRSKGFAFVEMPVIAEGQAAITALNGKVLQDRPLTVNTAKPRTDDRGGSSYGGGSGGRRGGGGGGYDRGRRY